MGIVVVASSSFCILYFWYFIARLYNYLAKTVSPSGGTTAGMFGALFFTFSPILIQRGNLGWFKSETLGLFFGLFAVYLFLSTIKRRGEEAELTATTAGTKYKMSILKAIIAGSYHYHKGKLLGSWPVCSSGQ